MIYLIGLRVVHEKLGNGTVAYIKHRNNCDDLITIKFDNIIEHVKDSVYENTKNTQRFLASTDKLKELR